jgi:lipopolysaccharide transport system ATP-binding protein
MSSDDAAIRVRDVCKHYLLFARPEDRLKQSIVPRLQRLLGATPKQYYRHFAALNGVSFDIRRGETVGIVGRNGSGKSTLLQIICGTLAATAGSIEINGRIAALLELGAGFNPQFTGRENVYMNGAILGMSAVEIDARFGAIAQFADIGEFIDQPVHTYSSGMYVRLAFATAINTAPDILVVDEALAVGDEAFQRKCFARIAEIQGDGGTILFVSHGMQSIVQLCTRVMLFDAGELLLDGRPKTVVTQYQRLVNASRESSPRVRSAIAALHRMEEDSASPPTIAAPATVEDALRPSPNAHPEGDVAAAAAEEYPPPLRENPQEPIDFYDADQKSLTTTRLEERGACIRDPRLLTIDGRSVNVLRLGRRYLYEYYAEFAIAAREVGFGFWITTVDGVGLAGAQTIHSRTHRLKAVAQATTARIRFEFIAAMLPATYFITCGILGTVDANRIVMHRIVDAVMFRVIPEVDLIATGKVDIGVSCDIATRAS